MRVRAYRLGVTVVGVAVCAALAVVMNPIGDEATAAQHEAPFGGKADVEFAEALWQAMDGYESWPMKSSVYPGTSPHGKLLRLYYNLVHVDGTPYHLIVKDNYGGSDATKEKVSSSPGEYLAAVTIMLQREAGYDPANNDWFWVKYAPDGSIEKNAKGMALAGRVAKGADKGCIACHKNAKGGDYVFTNDH